MPDLRVARRLPRRLSSASPPRARPAWWPTWSQAAGLRALRAVLVIPPLFAITFEGFGNLQMALFAAFGGFANLIFASFGGTRRDKLIAHLGLAVIGSVALIIGTAVNSITWLAVLVTIPVTFGIFFAGVAGPNAASGVNAALLLFVLPVATPGTISMIPDRLAGWWLASAVSTVAVLFLSPPPPGDRLRAAAANSAWTLASHLLASVNGTATGADMQACRAAKDQLLNTFAATPYRPVGLATADQGMAALVQLLEWCTALIADATDGHPNLDRAAQSDRDLLTLAARVLSRVGDLLSGAPDAPDGPTLLGEEAEIISAREASAAYHRSAVPGGGDYDAVEIVARHAFHAQAIAVAVQAIVADTLVATRLADPETIAARRRDWYGIQPEGSSAERRAAAVSGAFGVLARHASFRSVWFLNALRGSLALAAAVLVADLSGVQHGFWVVLGTLSVLRTNAASTESTALRALGGTAVGFVVGALLLLGIGTSPPALWVALPVALAVAAYAPGTLPFAFGQAAFTIVVVVLFNLLVPAGWRVGLLRIEDVGIGCLVSLIVGVVFWPRGASSVVGNDLADAFRRGAAYLNQAVDWALGIRHAPPDAGDAAVTAGIRLEEALRGFLAEQGAKKVSKEDLWMLVMGSMRLRLTAYSLAGLQAASGPGHDGEANSHHRHQRDLAYARTALEHATADLDGFYEEIATLVGKPVPNQVLLPVAVPAFTGLEGNGNAGSRTKSPGADESGSVNGVRMLALVDSDGSVATTDGTDEAASAGGAGAAGAAAVSGPAGPGGAAGAAGVDETDTMEMAALADEPGGADLLRMITGSHHPHLLWVHEHLQHLSSHADAITGPAVRIAEQRRLPWWR